MLGSWWSAELVAIGDTTGLAQESPTMAERCIRGLRLLEPYYIRGNEVDHLTFTFSWPYDRCQCSELL